ncbi:MAG: hypothetical protein NVSMB4_01510 [Acidimicrobiales bacterium]
MARAQAERGWTALDLYTRANLAPDTFARVEQGKTVRDTTYWAIEDALGWERGAIRAAVNDGSPAHGVAVLDLKSLPNADLVAELARRLHFIDPAALSDDELWAKAQEESDPNGR